MNTELFPENGSVVIVDDQYEEALPLMKILSRMDVSFKYFTGNVNELPGSPLKNVKIIFLDIQLEGMEGVQNDKTKMSTLANVIKRIVDTNSHPYIIIAWTKHQDLISDLNNSLNNNKPLFILSMAKDECKNNGNFDLNSISKKIGENISEFKSFKYFLFWQNLVNRASNIIVNDIASLIQKDEGWDKKLQKILKLLAEAYAGKQAINENTEKYSMLCFNNLLADIMERLIFQQNLILDRGENDSDLEDENIKGELNRRILISLEANTVPVPGNIYTIDENFNPSDLDKNKLIVELFNGKFQDLDDNDKNQLIEQSKLIILEVSPFCDYAQNKWIKNRILPGVMWPKQFKSKIKKADYIYRSPVLRIQNNLYFLVFDLRYLSSVEPDILKDKKSDMRIRKELLNDIQSRIAAHINRFGVTSL